MAIPASEARRDIFKLIEQVNLDQTEVEITSKRGSAVLMSKDEYDSLVETNYLLRSPKNADRLLSALNSARNNVVTEHELLSEDDATPVAPTESPAADHEVTSWGAPCVILLSSDQETQFPQASFLGTCKAPHADQHGLILRDYLQSLATRAYAELRDKEDLSGSDQAKTAKS